MNKPVFLLKDKNIIAVCCNYLTSLIIKDNGEIYKFGKYYHKELKENVSTHKPYLFGKFENIKSFSCGTS